MTKNEMIENYMKKLQISREEAIQLIEDDENDVSVELTNEQKAVIREMTTADRKKETTPRKRERKEDTVKRYLMKVLYDCFWGHVTDLEMPNPERELTFNYEGEIYKIILSRPRKTS